MTHSSVTGVNRRAGGTAAARTDTSRLRRITASAVLGVCTMLALTGCIKMDMNLTLDGDTVSGTMILAMDKKVLAMTGQTEEEAFASFNEEAPIPDGEGVTTEKYSDGTFVGNKYTLTNVSLDRLAEENKGDEEALRITHDTAAGVYRVTGVLDLTDSEAAPPEMTQLLDSMEIRIAITFPGKVISHTGELDGTTVVWRAKVGEKTTLQAEAEDTSSSNILLILGFGIPVALIVIGLVVFLIVRGKSRKPASAGSHTDSGHDTGTAGDAGSPSDSATDPSPAPSPSPTSSADSGGGDSGGGDSGGGGGDSGGGGGGGGD